MQLPHGQRKSLYLFQFYLGCLESNCWSPSLGKSKKSHVLGEGPRPACPCEYPSLCGRTKLNTRRKLSRAGSQGFE